MEVWGEVMAIAQGARQPSTRRRRRSVVGVTRESLGHAIREGVARDLHDSVARTLVTMLLELESFKAEQEGRESVLREVDVFQGFVRTALSSLRDTLNDLHEEPDLAGGLVSAIREILVPAFERSYRIPVSISIRGELQPGLPPETELNLYRIAQEALANVGRHSSAHLASLSLRFSRASVALDVTDDGHGFAGRGAAGFGTRSMHDRALLIGGRLKIDSRPGAGTRVRLRVPMLSPRPPRSPSPMRARGFAGGWVRR
jgi:two-component system sensor histidine kinase UhpB